MSVSKLYNDILAAGFEATVSAEGNVKLKSVQKGNKLPAELQSEVKVNKATFISYLKAIENNAKNDDPQLSVDNEPETKKEIETNTLPINQAEALTHSCRDCGRQVISEDPLRD